MPDRQLERLTERERAVVEAARSGASARVIAEQLFVSTRTVETHLGSIYRKLGVSGRVALMAHLHALDPAEDGAAPDGRVAGQAANLNPLAAKTRKREPAGTRHRPSQLTEEMPAWLVPAGVFVGRGFERAALASAVAGALDGARSTVMVGGEPGVGKSALVAAGCIEAQTMGVGVVAGRCDPDVRSAFLPFIAILRLTIAAYGTCLLAGAGPTVGALGTLLPELSGAGLPPPPSTDPAAERRLLAEGVLSVVRRALTIGPLVMVFEDLHWADLATLGLFRQLIVDPTLGGLVVWATFRNTDLDQLQELSGLLAHLWRDPTITRVDIEGLSVTETARLAGLSTGRTLDPRRVDLLRRRTNGNPLYILQVLADADASGERGRMSRSLREVILDRVDRLGRTAARTLEAAAVLGSEFDLNLLYRMVSKMSVAGATDRPGQADAVAEELALAVHAGLLAEERGATRRHRFVHDLVHEAIVEQLSGVRRAQLHEAAGLAILELHADEIEQYADELWAHFDAAALVGDRRRAAQWALAVARHSVARSAPDDAVTTAERGLVHAEGDDQLVLELLIVVTEAHAIRMDLERHRRAMFEALDVARRIGDPAAMARAIDRDTALPVMGTIDEELLAVKQEVLNALGPAPTEQRVRLLLSSVYQRTIGGQGWAASDQAQEALAAARHLGDPTSLVAALYAVASSTLGRPGLDEQRAAAEELTSLSSTGVDQVPERHGLRFRGPLRLVTGDRDGFEADAAELTLFASRTNSTFLQSMLGEWRVLQALLDGDLDAAEHRANAVLAVAGDEPNFLLGWLVEMIEIRIRQERVDELLLLADSTLREHPDLPVLRACVAGAHLEAGDEAGARSLAGPLFRDDRVVMGEDWLRPAGLGYLARVAAVLGPDERLAVDRQLRPYAGQLLVAGAGALVVGLADHLRARLMADSNPVGLDRSILLTASAIELADRVRSLSLGTDARIDRATLLRRRNRVDDVDEADALIGRARLDAAHLSDARAMTLIDRLEDGGPEAAGS